MTRHRSSLCAALLLVPLALVTHSAHACSCRDPQPVLLSPSSLGKIPVNARVRVALPNDLQGQLVLRKHQGTDVAVKRIDSPLQRVTHAELVPEKNSKQRLATKSPSFAQNITQASMFLGRS